MDTTKSDETTAVNNSGLVTQVVPNDCEAYNWRRPRSESSADAESGEKKKYKALASVIQSLYH